MNKNGIDHKDVPEHRLINAKKIAKERSDDNITRYIDPKDYGAIPNPKPDNMWTWIKKNALKRLLPFVKEVIDVDISLTFNDGFVHYDLYVFILNEKVWSVVGKKLIVNGKLQKPDGIFDEKLWVEDKD